MSSLNVHVKGVHEKLKPHACTKCEYSSNLRCNLQKHVEMVHENLKAFKCQICSRGFSQIGNLKSHVKASVTNREGGRFILSGIGSSGGTCFLAVFIFRH